MITVNCKFASDAFCDESKSKIGKSADQMANRYFICDPMIPDRRLKSLQQTVVFLKSFKSQKDGDINLISNVVR